MDNLISGLGFSRKKSFDEFDGKTAPKPSDLSHHDTSSKTTSPQQHDDDFDLSDDAVVYEAPLEELEEGIEKDIESLTQEDTPLTSAASVSQTTQTTENAQGGIGPKIFIRGEIVGEEDLVIQGKVEGSVDLSGHHLTIGVNGAVIANIKAKVVTIEGNVAGDVSAEELIEIKASSQVKGNLVCERVVLEDGARFKGSIDMSVDDFPEDTPFKTKETSEGTAKV